MCVVAGVIEEVIEGEFATGAGGVGVSSGGEGVAFVPGLSTVLPMGPRSWWGSFSVSLASKAAIVTASAGGAPSGASARYGRPKRCHPVGDQ
ncbi:hypothetical protein SALBM311S_07801 [Streptomyces alboniger]